MSKKDQLRKRIYNTYSDNLDFIRKQSFVNIEPDLNNSYICPLCIRLFTKKHLNQKVQNCLTIEDVPPKSLGGKPLLLTCKECNNESGRNLDEELRKKLILEEFSKKVPGSQIDAKMQFSSGLFTSCAMSYREDGGLSVHLFKNGLKAKKGKRKCFPKVSESIRETGFNNTLLNIKTYKPKRPRIALLRVAYLLAIAKFGYSFLFNDNLEAIRNQIKHPDKGIINNFGIIESNHNSYDEGVYIVSKPSELRSFLIIFKLNTGKQVSLHSVVLPGFNENGLEIYNQINLVQEREKTLYLKIRKVPDRKYLIDRQVCFGPQILWEEINKINA